MILVILQSVCALTKGLPSLGSYVSSYDYFEANVPSCFLQDGTCRIWNLSDIEQQDIPKKMELYWNKDSCMNVAFEDNVCPYRIRHGSIDLIRQEQPTFWQEFFHPITGMFSNSILGSMDSCAFEAKGKYCGKNALTKKGTFVENVDAEGIMILESFDTLSNVSRKHGAIISDIAIFEDSTENAKPIIFDEKEEYYLWYYKDSLVPILIQKSKTLSKDGEKIYCEKVAYLMDKEQILLLKKKYKKEEKCVQTSYKGDNPIASHAISFENESKKLHVSIRVSQPIRVSVLVSTTNGVLMLHRQIDCGAIATNEGIFDCSTLPKGQYAVSIQAGKYMECEKFIIH